MLFQCDACGLRRGTSSARCSRCGTPDLREVADLDEIGTVQAITTLRTADPAVPMVVVDLRDVSLLCLLGPGVSLAIGDPARVHGLSGGGFVAARAGGVGVR